MFTRPGVTTAPPRSTVSAASGGMLPPTASTCPFAIEHPAVGMLGALVVHRHDVRVREQQRHAT